MKRLDLIKQITEKGDVLVRHGSNHDIYIQPKKMVIRYLFPDIKK